MLSRFINEQCHRDFGRSGSVSQIEDLLGSDDLPTIRVFHSATAVFYAPSDLSGINGMKREIIRAAPSWRNGHPRYDCVFVETDPDNPGMRGLDVARLILLFSFDYEETTYPCALVHWFDRLHDAPDEETGMWVVNKALQADGNPHVAILHLNSVLRAAHLVPIYGEDFVEPGVNYSNVLDKFASFYVNKYVDHHANEIAF